MIKFLLSRFISKDKAFEVLDEHQENIENFSQRNKHLSAVVKTGFKIWSAWRLLVIFWWVFLMILLLGGAYITYIIISRII